MSRRPSLSSFRLCGAAILVFGLCGAARAEPISNAEARAFAEEMDGYSLFQALAQLQATYWPTLGQVTFAQPGTGGRGSEREVGRMVFAADGSHLRFERSTDDPALAVLDATMRQGFRAKIVKESATAGELHLTGPASAAGVCEVLGLTFTGQTRNGSAPVVLSRAACFARRGTTVLKYWPSAGIPSAELSYVERLPALTGQELHVKATLVGGRLRQPEAARVTTEYRNIAAR
ncbi:MAG: hypothetical protein IT371_24725 [Deltaproteobacteria bacterium]|nr:hypothetical protein [Deltaproteobacteria bacterium]